MKTKQIDILVTSASRLDYLKLTVKSLQYHLKFSGKLNWILHEDVVNKEGSRQVIDWVYKSGIFSRTLETTPAQRQGAAVKTLLEASTTEFVIRTEDDWVLQRELNLDDVINVMEHCHLINQISFNKRRNSLVVDKRYQTYDCLDFELCLNWNWSFILGVWRRAFILPNWVVTSRGDDIGYYLRGEPVGSKLTRSEDWLVYNMGAYWWGGREKGEFVAHIGLESSLQSAVEVV